MKKLGVSLLLGILLVALLGGAAPALANGPESAPRQDSVHIVQPGETLFKISVRYGVPMNDIVVANGIVDPTRIYAGQRLIIPVPGSTVQPAQGAVQHTVQRGEILSRIALNYGVSMWSIMQANGISNASVLYAGQVLTIPGATAQAAPPPAEPVVAPAQASTYTIQPGDTLQRIALRHGTSVAALMAANSIADMNRIFWGQTLVIPGPGAPAPAPQAAPAPAAPTSAGKLVLVDLSEQRAYAYENGALLNSFVVSTGLPGTPTLVGTFSIYVKYRYAPMSGPGYYLPNVPYVMYYDGSYGLHGTYWHNNFGNPMSHGCINFRTPDAEWIYNWAPVGTTVQVQY